MDVCDTSAPRVVRGDLTVLPPSDVAMVTASAHAMSDPARVRMLWLLTQRDTLCTCEFEELLGLGQSRVSYHLKLLVDAGLVVRTRHGTWSHYQLARGDLLHCLRALAPGMLISRDEQEEQREEFPNGHHAADR